MIFHQRVVLELLYGMHVDIHTPVGAYHLRTLLDVAYSSLTQYVKLLITELLGSVHIPLRCGKPFGWHVEGSVTTQWFFRDKHPAGVDASQVGKVGYPVACPEDKVLYLTTVALGGRVVYEGVDLVCRQSVNLTQLADDGLAAEGVDGAKEGGMTVAVTAEDIFSDGVALLP